MVFYDVDGGMERTFDYSSDPSCREFTTASFNPTGDAVVLGNYDNFHVFSHNHRWDKKKTQVLFRFFRAFEVQGFFRCRVTELASLPRTYHKIVRPNAFYNRSKGMARGVISVFSQAMFFFLIIRYRYDGDR